MNNSDFSRMSLGECLKTLRIRRGLTQAELSGDDTSHYICSERNLRRYESNKTIPSQEILHKLLIILGSSHLELERLMDKDGLLYFNDKILSIKYSFYSLNFLEAEHKLKKLKEEHRYNKEHPIVEQSVLFCDAIIKKNLHNDKTNALRLLLKSLQAYSKRIFISKNHLDYNYISNNEFPSYIYEVFNSIANIYNETSQNDKAISLHESILGSLENELIPHEVKIKFLPGVYYNLSNAQLAANQLNKTNALLTKAIDYCKSVNDTKYLTQLFYNKGCVLFLLNNKTEAIICFKKAFILAEILENSIFSDIIIYELKSKFEIDASEFSIYLPMLK